MAPMQKPETAADRIAAAYKVRKARDPGTNDVAFAEECGVSRQTVQNWKSGRKDPAPDRWPLIAAYLGADELHLREGVSRDEVRNLTPEAQKVAAAFDRLTASSKWHIQWLVTTLVTMESPAYVEYEQSMRDHNHHRDAAPSGVRESGTDVPGRRPTRGGAAPRKSKRSR